jgi:stalled ribosome alternative rescue factor ArfA
MKHIILNNKAEFWNASLGWVESKHDATTFTTKEKEEITLPENRKWGEDYQEESDASYDKLWEHQPRTDPTDESCLLDCDPRMGDVTQREFDTAVKENRLWTIVEAERTLMAQPGLLRVNHITHHICKIPYKNNNSEILLNRRELIRRTMHNLEQSTKRVSSKLINLIKSLPFRRFFCSQQKNKMKTAADYTRKEKHNIRKEWREAEKNCTPKELKTLKLKFIQKYEFEPASFRASILAWSHPNLAYKLGNPNQEPQMLKTPKTLPKKTPTMEAKTKDPNTLPKTKTPVGERAQTSKTPKKKTPSKNQNEISANRLVRTLKNTDFLCKFQSNSETLQIEGITNVSNHPLGKVIQIQIQGSNRRIFVPKKIELQETEKGLQCPVIELDNFHPEDTIGIWLPLKIKHLP